MAAYKTRAFVRSKYYTPFEKTPRKWIPRSKPGASKSRLRWAAHTRIGNVWEYLPPGPKYYRSLPLQAVLFFQKSMPHDTSNFYIAGS